VLAVCDGERAVALAPAQDFKRAGDGDTGPNTGGMGAYSPVPLSGAEVCQQVMERAVEPTLHALRERGVDYRGVLYAGLMLTADGPKVLEYNVRFGDPEAQVVLPRLESDLTDLLAQAAGGRLHSEPRFDPRACVAVVAASEGYPERPRTGDPIAGIDDAAASEGVDVFCAGVGRDGQGRLVTAGGRVLDVCGSAPTIPDARRRAYAAVGKVRWPGMWFRRDIAAGVGGASPRDGKEEAER
jgi:phosphoribosylamine--glycine ligase